MHWKRLFIICGRDSFLTLIFNNCHVFKHYVEKLIFMSCTWPTKSGVQCNKTEPSVEKKCQPSFIILAGLWVLTNSVDALKYWWFTPSNRKGYSKQVLLKSIMQGALDTMWNLEKRDSISVQNKNEGKKHPWLSAVLTAGNTNLSGPNYLIKRKLITNEPHPHLCGHINSARSPFIT